MKFILTIEKSMSYFSLSILTNYVNIITCASKVEETKLASMWGLSSNCIHMHNNLTTSYEPGNMSIFG